MVKHDSAKAQNLNFPLKGFTAFNLNGIKLERLKYNCLRGQSGGNFDGFQNSLKNSPDLAHSLPSIE